MHGPHTVNEIYQSFQITIPQYVVLLSSPLLPFPFPSPFPFRERLGYNSTLNKDKTAPVGTIKTQLIVRIEKMKSALQLFCRPFDISPSSLPQVPSDLSKICIFISKIFQVSRYHRESKYKV